MPAEQGFDLPLAWRADLAGYARTKQTIGRSEALVLRLEASGRPTLFIKTAPAGLLGGLTDEAARLQWLATKGIACPQVVAQMSEAGRDWLLLTALPGRDLASSPDLAPARIAEIAADALRALHRLDVAACPFDHRFDRRIASARARMAAGLVDETDFDEERRGRTAADLFRELVARHPASEDLVVAHGDACLPNLLADDGRFTGFVDCARLGVADRHQDLALASRSIRHNLGEHVVGRFLQRYGAATDPERLTSYLLLDEFF